MSRDTDNGSLSPWRNSTDTPRPAVIAEDRSGHYLTIHDAVRRADPMMAHHVVRRITEEVYRALSAQVAAAPTYLPPAPETDSRPYCAACSGSGGVDTGDITGTYKTCPTCKGSGRQGVRS